MRFREITLCAAVVAIVITSASKAQSHPPLDDATPAVLHAFETHDLVLLGEIHGNKQEYEWLRSLVATAKFADRVDDIVMEFGNSLYQSAVDRYVSGGDVPFGEVEKAWQNTVGSIGPPSPVYASLYKAVRESNLRRRGKHKIRIVCGDPSINWDTIKERKDIYPYLSSRDVWYTQVVKNEVLAKHHRALLIMGSFHFLRNRDPQPHGMIRIEQSLRMAGASTYLIVAGTNGTADPGRVDHRFDSWRPLIIAQLANTWVGDLPALPVILGGGHLRPSPPPPLTLREAADALLYLGPRDSLTQVFTPRSQIKGTLYGRESEHRLELEGFPIDYGISNEPRNEGPQFPY